jgi:hypothetical protein
LAQIIKLFRGELRLIDKQSDQRAASITKQLTARLHVSQVTFSFSLDADRAPQLRYCVGSQADLASSGSKDLPDFNTP